MKQSNKERAVLTILKNPEKEFNSNSLSGVMGISAMGTLKILRGLEKEGVLVSRKISNIRIFGIDFGNDYARGYISFILKKEREFLGGVVKRWVGEVAKAGSPELAILFGSVLGSRSPKDIDVLFVVGKENFSKLKKEVEDINLLNEKKIHPVYQTKEDFLENIRKGDVVVLGAVKGIVVCGSDLLVKLIGESK